MSLTITNNSSESITIYENLNNIESKIIVDAETVINVDTIEFFIDSNYSTAYSSTPGANDIITGSTVYIQATISDPFGAQDITGANLTLIDPTLANQLTSVAMTEFSAAGVQKVYRYAYTLPEATAVAAGGPWVAQVTVWRVLEGAR